MLEPGQAERLGRLFEGPSLPASLAAHVRALEVGLDQAAAEYATTPAMLRAAFTRWGFDLGPLERQPRLPKTPAPAIRPAADAATAAALPQVPPPTAQARVERAFLEREVAGGERLSGEALAHELGVTRSPVFATLARLRALRVQDPGLAVLRTRFAAIQRMTAAELAEAAEQLRAKHADAIEVGLWWRAAACGGMDPERFFPADHGKAEAARAKRVCAACPVRQQCLRADLHAPVGDRRSGVFGGMAPAEREALRSVQGPGTGRLRADRALAEAAHRRAAQVGTTQAATELDVDRTTLARAFARWGLPPVSPGPRVGTPAQAAEAHALALRWGIAGAAQRLGTSHGALREAFHRFGLAWPPPRPRTPTPPPVRLVDPVFFAVNPALVVPAGLSREAASARVRRQEEFELLGPRVIYALGDENDKPRHRRAWYVAKRARDAGWPEADRDGQTLTTGPGRPAGPAITPTRTGTGTERGTGTTRRDWDGGRYRDGERRAA
jgi:WhiB family redox-sensing transcriptional regulator